MESVKERLRELITHNDIEGAYSLIDENLAEEISVIQSDPEYCVLAATAYMRKEIWERAFDLITIGLICDGSYYELYLMLGEYYGRNNINQALLCFYQALFYCDDDNDKNVIEDYIQKAENMEGKINHVTFVIVTKNDSENLKRCLDSIVSTVPLEMISVTVVDNGSEDGTNKWVSGIDGVYAYFNDEDIGYVSACNQGIKLSDTQDDIFILDPDVMLPENAFFYLMLGLYADDNNGIAGGATNAFINEQKMELDISDIESALNIARNVNCPMENAYERVVRLSDFAMLIRRKVLDKVGLLDEEYNPAMLEDADFCTRANLAGFNVILCLNSYVFKYEDRLSKYGDLEILKANSNRVYKKKWNCSVEYSDSPRAELMEFIKEKEDEPISILELGCAMGGTLNRIKRMWPKSQVYGIEYDEAAAKIGASVTNIIQGDVENMPIPYEKEQFDYIICADVLEHLRDPEGTILRFMPYLKSSGHFIVSLPNVRYYAVLELLAVNGRFDYADHGILDRTHVKFFTLDTAKEMLDRCGLNVEEIKRNYNDKNGTANYSFIERFAKAFEITAPEEMKVFQYFFLASKS